MELTERESEIVEFLKEENELEIFKSSAPDIFLYSLTLILSNG